MGGGEDVFGVQRECGWGKTERAWFRAEFIGMCGMSRGWKRVDGGRKMGVWLWLR